MKNFLLFLFTFVFVSISVRSVELEPIMNTTISGPDELYKADVKQDADLENRLYVDAYISDSVEIGIVPGSISDRYQEYFKNGGSEDMRVDGSSTPVEFTIPIDPTKTILISQIRCFGGGTAIKMDGFITKTSALTNGVSISIRSEGIVTSFVDTMKTTSDFKNIFSFPYTDPHFLIYAPSGDQMLAIYKPTVPFPLKNATSDYVKITVQDDLSGPSTGLSQFECMVDGFKK